jgi:ComF family protein
LPVLPTECCPVCAIPTPGGEICGACLKRPPAFDRTIALYQYAFPASVLIQQLKYHSELALAPWLADRLVDALGDAERPDLIMPMPLHENRLKERGFNQAALLARRVSSRLETAIDLNACRRVRDTQPQVELPFKLRQGNIRKAFVCDLDLTGKRVALVDDVMTSGASLDELAKTVKQAGAAQVWAWVIARAVKD